jgi:UDPglucose 6-dehydrogenase
MVHKIVRASHRSDHDLAGVTVGALGLTFKAGTDDLRESPAIAIIGELRAAGASIRAFDPTTVGELSPHQSDVLAGIELVDDPLHIADGADVMVLFTEWPEFAELDLSELAARAGAGTTLVDTRNLLDPTLVRESGLNYDGVGRN